ncbi:Response regulator VieA [Vibrio vulnificus]|uniref:Response regulator VieA n=1 Tax=Vibrio vulnificus (strain CMCP6) TaxID=216895 RepID=A0A3Q0L761_VIBVU|nr:EAL domain-containing protein [Vibrio vulnificus]AAO11516.1 Response regulator VieA [Vibrio vulnificus CMCP6]QBN13540.1 EAL domain-containing protein [Vibrio vulnificus]
MKVLIVEDDKIQSSKLKIDLRNLGYSQVYIAPSCQVAIDLYKEHRFELIFCDIQLPDNDGIYLLNQLAHISRSPHVIIMSASSKKVLLLVEQISSMLKFKRVSRIDKPYTKGQLSEVVEGSQARHHSSVQLKQARALEFTEREIAEAIALREIFVHYQPQVNVGSGFIVGLEVLARWDHPDYGLVSAGEFIDAITSDEIYINLFRTVLEKALIGAKTLHKSVTLSINITYQDLQWDGLYDELVKQCSKYEFDVSRLTLELTESHLYQSDIPALLTLSRLKLLGVNLSIDDLGSGYSSLSKLTQIPFDEIKIDKSFVQGIETDYQKFVIVQLLLNLAEQLGFSCVVEGVETDATLHYLKSMGRFTCQGYLTGRPMPINQVQAMLNQRLSSSDSVDPIHCLIVDDHPVVGSALCQAFTRVHQVQTVASETTILKALNYIRDSSCNLLLIDVDLRGEHGYELIKQAKKIGFNGKAILMTSSGNRFIPVSQFDETIQFVDKEIQVDQLVHQVISIATTD